MLCDGIYRSRTVHGRDAKGNKCSIEQIQVNEEMTKYISSRGSEQKFRAGDRAEKTEFEQLAKKCYGEEEAEATSCDNDSETSIAEVAALLGSQSSKGVGSASWASGGSREGITATKKDD